MTRLYWHLMAGAVIAFGGLAGMLFAARFGMYSDVVTLIFLAGAVGAVVNNYYRLAKLSESESAFQAASQSKMVIIQMYVSILIAGILALVAYGLFLSGLIGGSLFPTFVGAEGPYKDVSSMLVNLGPKTDIDAAKSILWAFIAGFSERFVPNIIDALIAKATPK